MKSKIGNRVYDWSKLKDCHGYNSSKKEHKIESIYLCGNILEVIIKEICLHNRYGVYEAKRISLDDEHGINYFLYQLHNWYGIEFKPEIELEKITSIKRLKEVRDELKEKHELKGVDIVFVDNVGLRITHKVISTKIH